MVLKEVPPYATVVGVPGRVVRVNGEKTAPDLVPEKDDPILKEVCALRERMFALEALISDQSKHYDGKGDVS